jgi:hypothetical protein
MNNIFQKIKKQKGAASIFITMLILTGMLSVALTVSSIVQNGIVMSRAHLNSTKAYFAAESGAERILWRIRQETPTALDPKLLSWESDKCVVLADPISSCNLDCEPTGAPDSNLYDDLDNTAKYRIKYQYDLPTNMATFSTTGIFEDITKRVVQVRYQF